MARITQEDIDAVKVLRAARRLSTSSPRGAAARLVELGELLSGDKPKKKRKAKTGEDRMEDGGMDRSVE
jgi:hypothetical protein